MKIFLHILAQIFFILLVIIFNTYDFKNHNFSDFSSRFSSMQSIIFIQSLIFLAPLFIIRVLDIDTKSVFLFSVIFTITTIGMLFLDAIFQTGDMNFGLAFFAMASPFTNVIFSLAAKKLWNFLKVTYGSNNGNLP